MEAALVSDPQWALHRKEAEALEHKEEHQYQHTGK